MGLEAAEILADLGFVSEKRVSDRTWGSRIVSGSDKKTDKRKKEGRGRESVHV